MEKRDLMEKHDYHLGVGCLWVIGFVVIAVIVVLVSVFVSR